MELTLSISFLIPITYSWLDQMTSREPTCLKMLKTGKMVHFEEVWRFLSWL